MSREIISRPAERMLDANTALVRLTSVSGDDVRELSDWLAVEEPLEIRAAGPGQTPVSVAVTMRTPGDDADLAVGFLVTEGFITRRDHVVGVRPDAGRGDSSGNIVVVDLTTSFDDAQLKRNFFATSSCGICGKASLEQVSVRCAEVGPGPIFTRETIVSLPARLRSVQAIFDRTGGLHAAGLFDRDGTVHVVREDVGRHNAVDKLVGRSLLDGSLPLSDSILMVSGRTSFEIIQKAAVAGVPLICAVSAPSSLAVSLADRLGITLVGFLRGDEFNIYTYPERIDGVTCDHVQEVQ